MTPPRIELPQKPTFQKSTFTQGIYDVFHTLEGSFDACFLLESLTDGPQSRYTIVGFAPEHIIRGNDTILTIDSKKYVVDNPYMALRNIIPHHVLSRGFVGGLVGYMSYEAADFFEPSLSLKHHSKFDQFCFGLYTDGLIYDKTTGETMYFYYKASRLADIEKILKKPKIKSTQKTEVTFKGYSLTKDEHRDIVLRVKEKIKQGLTFQCEVGFRSTFTIQGSALPLYEELRRVNPSPHMYFMKFGKQVILGASPELLFQLRDGEMESYPLAGTIKRGETPEEDQKLARQLVNDPKERAEHAMLVDMQRNDIGRVARFGTVRVRNLFEVKKFSYVQHLSSEVTGLIAPEHDMFTALASSFPMGTLSGAPKIESMKIINENEKDGRGPYGGAVGFFGFNGDCMFAIPIRSLYISGEEMYTQTSGGIVHDSTPEKEYEEILNKLSATQITLQKFLTP
ncbi:MAG: anthranilate synthase component I [Candidatus Taylorbacteria bacterium CG11_big_fil_rev_8_21_14_0_20_46_11]|uniref:Anthranilate synthase component I n=1 Tax=Candidatus Taylorbacteria bacterium CG11_big_fil_rev_8_21_14_0_20_46_11 TaxID=1975025 RepID=A0A2H0KD75_9BACT|nr:MAG: anthranilate synthase component I [Candidatus Taylorbacteria bacterium CG11_big_fil_rev_8_21_14_0_20_46_11]